MLIIFVKHYLNTEGIHFFKTHWFPSVKSAIEKQAGFIYIDYDNEITSENCINIKLIFKDKETLEQWASTQIHDDLIDLLDPYRIRNWQVATLETNHENPSDLTKLAWETVIPRTVIYNPV